MQHTENYASPTRKGKQCDEKNNPLRQLLIISYCEGEYGDCQGTEPSFHRHLQTKYEPAQVPFVSIRYLSNHKLGRQLPFSGDRTKMYSGRCIQLDSPNYGFCINVTAFVLNSIILHMVAKICMYWSLFSRARGLFSDYNKILSHIFAQLLNSIAQITLHKNHKPSSRQEFDLLILHSVGTGEVLLSTYKEQGIN